MTKTKSLPFPAFRDFLAGLRFSPHRTSKGWVFEHPKEGPLVYRLYEDDENVDPWDLNSTRRFLDMRGVMDGEVFDAYLQKASASA